MTIPKAIEFLKEIRDTTFADDDMTDRSESRRIISFVISILERIDEKKRVYNQVIEDIAKWIEEDK
jgi:hypothetical protein